MEVKSAIYNDINMFQVKEAREFIQSILANHPGREFNTILDVGCGSGNVTKLLEDILPHSRIVAFDIDAKMINFADNNNRSRGSCDRTTEFLIEDVAKSWDDLSPKIKALEGTIDLIFSNYALHWVDDYESSCYNMYRLLKPGGHIYANIGIVKSICDFVTSEEKTWISKYIKINDSETQIQQWSLTLQDLGCVDVEAEMFHCMWKFQTSKEFMEMLKLFRNRYLKYIVDASVASEIERERLVTKVEDLVYRSLSVKTGTHPVDQFDMESCLLFYDRFTVKARKPFSNETSRFYRCSIL